MEVTIIDTLEPLQNLLEGPDYHGLHWQRACLAYWGAVLGGLPEEKRDRPCPWTVNDMVLALEHIDFMELHQENEAIYTWLLATFPSPLGNDANSELDEVPYPLDHHGR